MTEPQVTDEAIENYMLTESLGRMIRSGKRGMSSIPQMVKGAIARRAWESIFCHPTKTLVKFDSVTDWIRAKPPEGLDTTEEVIEALIKSSQDTEALDNFQQLVRRATPAIGSHGGDRRSDSAPKGNRSGNGGTGADYLAARLKRDHPELLEDIGKGKRFPSVGAAATAAGIIKPVLRLSLTTPEKLAADLQKRLPEDVWAQFVAVVAAGAGLVKPEADQGDRRVVPARAAKAKPQAKRDESIKDVPISFLAQYANGVRSAKSVLATFYGSTNIDFYAQNAWKAVEKSLQIFVEADPDEEWGRIQWGDHPWQAVEVKDKWEFLDKYIKPIIEQGRPIISRYDAIVRAQQQPVTATFEIDSPALDLSKRSKPDRVKILTKVFPGLLRDALLDLRRDIAHYDQVINGRLWSEVASSEDEYFMTYYGKPKAWFEEVKAVLMRFSPSPRR